MMLRKAGSVVAAVAVAVGVGLVSAPADAARANEGYCGIHWGSGTKTAAPSTAGYVTDIRAGKKPCYDRLVFDIGTAAPEGFRVSYVDKVREDASGETIPVRGGARLQITVYAPAYDQSNRATYQYEDRNELVDVHGYRTFRQVVWAGSWEGTTIVGLGVRGKLPFRASTRADAIVIDVAHKW